MKAKIRKMEDLLEKEFKEGRSPHTDRDPVDNLILTILSQNTNDSLRDRAYQSLRRRFPSNLELAGAGEHEISEAIKIAGLHRQKSRTIKGALAAIRQESGHIGLSFLEGKTTDEAIAFLKKIKGVGDKTAALVMLFSFGRKTFPVDTHIERILTRTGLVPEHFTPEKIRRAVEPHISHGRARSLHLHLITLGKRVCRASRPRCTICPLIGLCAFALSAEGGRG